MNRSSLAMMFAILCLTTPDLFAGSKDLYLRPIGPAAGPPRYELLSSRPVVLSPDIVRIDLACVDGLDEALSSVNAGGTFYLVRTSLHATGARYRVETLAPGVSYMQSIGGGYRHPTAGTSSKPRIRSDAAACPAPPQRCSNSTPKRPFGWPAYQNPLERRAYR